MDTLTVEQRHRNMCRVKSRDTKIEVKVRKFLFHLGFRYRKNVKSLPGTPDVVLPKYKTVIFVNGCLGFYSYKFKKFICAAALGLMPARPWSGVEEANGGYIIVTTDGDLLAYHIYNRDYFETYLLNNTIFERASTRRHNYCSVYKENGHMYFKLNLQIRFV